MRDESKPIDNPYDFSIPEHKARFMTRMDAANRTQAEYDKHIAPVVTWLMAEANQDKRQAASLCLALMNDESTSDGGYAILRRVFDCVR